MSMKPQPTPEIPPEMVRIAHEIFPKGNIYIHLRDTVGTFTSMSRLPISIRVVDRRPMLRGG